MKSRRTLKPVLVAFLFIFVLLGLAFFVFKIWFSSPEGSRKKEMKEVVIDNQLALPQTGEQIAIITVKNYGEIRLRLFDTAAPKTVKHFINLAKAGKYNGLKFDEIISDLKVQCGDEADEVAAQQPIVEHNASLHNYNGAVGAVRISNDDGKYVGQTGQFYIIFSEDGMRADFDYLQKNPYDYGEGRISVNGQEFVFEEDVREKYRHNGGYPVFDIAEYNIFAQVYEGIDVLSKIANCPKDFSNIFDDGSSPAEDIIIEKVEIKLYGL